MYKAKVIFGSNAVRAYFDLSEPDSADSLSRLANENDGEYREYEFETEAEVRAFSMAVDATVDWMDAIVLCNHN